MTEQSKTEQPKISGADQAQTTDPYVFSDECLRLQLETAASALGYKILRFYVDERGRLSKTPTERTETFYLSPSGGALRDKEMNIVLYSARYDKHKGIGKTLER